MLLLQGVACVARTWQCCVVSWLFHRAGLACLEMERRVLPLRQALELQQRVKSQCPDSIKSSFSAVPCGEALPCAASLAALSRGRRSSRSSWRASGEWLSW